MNAIASAYPGDELRLLAAGDKPLVAPPAGDNVTIVRPDANSKRYYARSALLRWPRLDRALGRDLDVFWAATAPLSVSRNVPMVLTVHDLSFEQRPQDFTLYDRIYHKLTRARAQGRRAQRILVTTRTVRDEVVAAWGTTPTKRCSSLHQDHNTLRFTVSQLRSNASSSRSARMILGFESSEAWFYIPISFSKSTSRPPWSFIHYMARSVARVGKSLVLLARRERRQPWPGYRQPLNGQRSRLRVVSAILEEFEPDVVVETGTFLGDTTAFFASLGFPIWSLERDLVYYAIARLRFRRNARVRLVLGDSADILSRHEWPPSQRVFAYLDAHWGGRVPLNEEVAALSRASDVVAVIDDFRVPHDPRYGFDVYDNFVLELGAIRLPRDAFIAYPRRAASRESGARRGTLYVALGPRAAPILRQLVNEGLLVEATDS